MLTKQPRRSLGVALLWLAIACLAPGKCAWAVGFMPPTETDISSVQPFDGDQKLVGTYYFYWYRWPDSHFFDDQEQTDDALVDHFPDAESVSYESTDWHYKELKDIAGCGIDIVLPVYWGAPGNYDITSFGKFSTTGLHYMQEALDRLVAEQGSAPKIGMFYDTSTLLNSVRGVEPRDGKADLMARTGKRLFYETIRDFFYQVRAKHWASIDGQPLVVLYSASFAEKYDASTFEFVYSSFERDFHGLRPYIVREASWKDMPTESSYRWGAALHGPMIDGIAQIGPGYDDTAVPGRTTPIRKRENGTFYENSWADAIESGRTMVFIETWNEMHEGTDICESREHGRRYIELTKKYVALFKQGKPVDRAVALEHPDLQPRPPSEFGSIYRNVRTVFIDLSKRPKEIEGLFLVPLPDGPFLSAETAAKLCVRTPGPGSGYLYFKMVDPFYYNNHEPVEVMVEYFDSGSGSFHLEYDSHDRSAMLDGAYKTTDPVGFKGTEKWVKHTFVIEDARFINRQNGGADFRLAIDEGTHFFSKMSVTKVGKTP